MPVTNREQLKQYVFRALGAPLINIDVATEQLEDRVDEGIAFFREYYWDGIKKEYFKHQITAQNKIDKFIIIPDYIWSVNRVFNASNSTNGQPNIFDLEYQLRMNDMRDLTSTSIVYYEQVMEHIALLQNRLNADRQFDFNRLEGKLYLNLNWDAKIFEGNFLLLDCYSVLDPDTSPKMWNERLFKEYITALTKKQWAQNLSKYQNVSLPGGVTIDAQTMYNTASDEIDKIEDQIMNSLSPLEFFMG